MIKIRVITSMDLQVPEGEHCWKSTRHSSLDCSHVKYPEYQKVQCGVFDNITLKVGRELGEAFIIKCDECKKAKTIP